MENVMRQGSSQSQSCRSVRMLRRSVLVAALITALSACDNSDVKTTTTADPAAVATQKKALSDTDLAQMAKQSQGKTLTLLDASELQLDGAAALVLTFSIPLDPKQQFADSVHLVDTEKAKSTEHGSFQIICANCGCVIWSLNANYSSRLIPP